MVYKVWDITTVPKILCTWLPVICNMVYKVWKTKNEVNMGSGDMKHGL